MLPLGPRAESLRHVRAPVPLRFPESAEMPEGYDHLFLRTFLFQLFSHILGPDHSVGSDQFMYWVPTDPKICLAPDAFVKLGVPQTRFRTWQCWRHGAPDLAIEIVSPYDAERLPWDKKFARYTELGVLELLRFDPEASEGNRVRVWDRIDGDFIERVVEGDATPCVTLGLSWTVRPVDILPVALRLVDASGALVRTATEEATDARLAAEARVRELEEELRRR